MVMKIQIKSSTRIHFSLVSSLLVLLLGIIFLLEPHTSDNFITGSFLTITSNEENTANWNKNFSSNGSNIDAAFSVSLASNGDVYVVGYGWNLTGQSSGYDWWLKKFNSSGTEDTANWNKNFSSYGSNIDSANSVTVASNDDVYVVGYGTNLTGSSSSRDWWLKKFNSSGTEDTTNWNKNFSSTISDWDVANFVALASNGDVYIAGDGTNLTGSSIGGNTGADWWLKKFNSSGTEDTTNWNKNFSSAGSKTDTALSVSIASNGDVYVVGYGSNLTGSSSSDDWWIKKFNSSGTEDTTNWNKNFSSAGGNSDVTYSVIVAPNGDVYVMGYGVNLTGSSSSRDWWLKKFNSSGTEDTTNWNKNFSSYGNNIDSAYSAAVAPTGDLYVVGQGFNLSGESTFIDWWLKKFNSSGTEDTANWNKNFSSDGSNADVAYSVAIAPNSHIYVVGYGINLTGSSSSSDWWIKKFNPAPNVTALIPPQNSAFNISQAIEIAANVSDVDFISIVTANITAPNGSIQEITLSNSTGYGNKFNTTYTIPASAGVYTIRIIANDTENSIESSKQTNFTANDVTPPNVTALLPLRDSVYYPANLIEISANVTDNTFISQVWANFSHANGSLILYELSNGTAHPSKFNLSFAAPRMYGEYNFIVVTNDTSNNYNRTESTEFTLAEASRPNTGDPSEPSSATRSSASVATVPIPTPLPLPKPQPVPEPRPAPEPTPIPETAAVYPDQAPTPSNNLTSNPVGAAVATSSLQPRAIWFKLFFLFIFLGGIVLIALAFMIIKQCSKNR